jgi:hypothetical protein
MEMKLHYVVRRIDKHQFEYIAGPFPYHECINYMNENQCYSYIHLDIMSRIIPNCELEK